MIIILSTILKIPSNILGSYFRKNGNKQIFNWNILDSYSSFQNVQFPACFYILTRHEERFNEVNVKDFLFQSSHLNSRLRLQN